MHLHWLLIYFFFVCFVCCNFVCVFFDGLWWFDEAVAGSFYKFHCFMIFFRVKWRNWRVFNFNAIFRSFLEILWSFCSFSVIYEWKAFPRITFWAFVKTLFVTLFNLSLISFLHTCIYQNFKPNTSIIEYIFECCTFYCPFIKFSSFQFT